MIQLQVLGTLELRGADGGALHSVLAQPKRQGLLAYLAVAVPRGHHRRDALVGMFWPESDDERARASLSRAVNHLRQTLGAETIVSRGHGELAIDWSRLQCDAAAFEAALDRGDLAAAMGLYRGDLLPAFYMEDAPEFERWLERERVRLRGRAIQAAKELSDQEEADGRLGAATEWARRMAALDPLDENAARRVMTLLDRAGDRAGALRTYEEFSARLASELDAEPSPETRDVADAIRERPSSALTRMKPVATATYVPPASATVAGMPVSSSAPTPTATPAPEAAPVAVVGRAPRRPSAMAIAVATAAAVAIVAAGVALLTRRPAVDAGAAQATVAVMPFVVKDGAAGGASRIGADVGTLLAEHLNHSGVLQVINARAVRSLSPVEGVPPNPGGAGRARGLLTRFGPRFVLLGEVASTGDSLRIDAALFDSTVAEPVARAAVTAPASDLAKMAAELAWQLVSARPTRRAPLWDRSPSVLTQSVPALQAFLAGEHSYAVGRFAEAAKSYRAAVDADTAFALAYFRLARSANWAGDYALEIYANGRTLEHLGRLTMADQFIARAWDNYLKGNVVEAERLTQLALVNTHGMADAWYLLGEIKFHWGRVLGWSIPEARKAYELAHGFGPTAGTLVHLARLAAAEQRVAAVDSLVAAAIAMGVDAPQALELRALRALAMGDRAEVSRAAASISRLDDAGALSVVSIVATHGAELGGVQEIARALRRSGDAAVRVSGLIFEAELATARGQLREAGRIMQPGRDITAARALEYRASQALLPHRVVSRPELEELRRALVAYPMDDMAGPGTAFFQQPRIYRPRQQYLIAMLSLKLGDTATTARITQELAAVVEKHGDKAPNERIMVGVLRAEVLRASNRPAEALAAMGAPSVTDGLPTPLVYHAAHARFLRGELLRELRRWEEAARWYETFPDPGAYDIAYLPAVHAALGASQEGAGRRDLARASYQRALSLWAAADEELSPAVAAVRERVAALR